METISTATELQQAIQKLEVDQEVKAQILKEQFMFTFESLKPINMLKSTLKEAVTSPNLIENVVGTGLGLVTGYLSRKIVVGRSLNILRRVLGNTLQYGVTNIVAQNSGSIGFIKQIASKLFSRKETSRVPE